MASGTWIWTFGDKETCLTGGTVQWDANRTLGTLLLWHWAVDEAVPA